MKTMAPSGSTESQSWPQPIQYIEAAHAASEYDEIDLDFGADEDPLRGARGVLSALVIVFAAACVGWLGSQLTAW